MLKSLRFCCLVLRKFRRVSFSPVSLTLAARIYLFFGNGSSGTVMQRSLLSLYQATASTDHSKT